MPIAYEYQIKPCRDESGEVLWCNEDEAEFFGVYQRPLLKWEPADECWTWVEDFTSSALAYGFIKDKQFPL